MGVVSALPVNTDFSLVVIVTSLGNEVLKRLQVNYDLKSLSILEIMAAENSALPSLAI